MPPSADSGGTVRAQRSFGDGLTLGEPPAKKHRGNDDTRPADRPARRQAACQACRRRKVRCDKERPCCAICRATDLNCEYPDDPDDKLTLDGATKTILERLGQLSNQVDSVKQVLWISDKPIQRQPSTSTTKPPYPGVPNSATVEPSREFLRIPPCRTSADTILGWDVFRQKYPSNALIGTFFSHNDSDHSAASMGPVSPSADLITTPLGLTPPDEEQIPALVDRFLQNVHTKNPILDVESLVKHGRRCADDGVGWDGWSCLVLLACALGSIAKPFEKPAPGTSGLPISGRKNECGVPSSARMYARELQQGDSCFTLACRRLGSLQYSMLGAQCYFFAGVYLTYTLRTIRSWHYFHQASVFCQFYLRMSHGISGSFAEVLDAASSKHLNSSDRKAQRLEQSLYWSCFKSECEFRVELPLPQSEISLGEYSNLFPSPPSPLAPEGEPAPYATSAASVASGLDGVSPSYSRSSIADEELELRRHAVRLCNEEESWYYYLTEIALRRIGNRIINTFFQLDRSFWLNIKPLLRVAQEFEVQVSSWSAHLPPAMQHYETTSIIRAPQSSFLSEEAGSHVSRELSWAIDNRLLEMQTWLYQPFLYYLVHVGLPGCPPPAHAPIPNDLLNPFPTPGNSSTPYSDSPNPQPAKGTAPLNGDDVDVLSSLINSGIGCCLKTIEVRARGYRHHGLWYDLRSIMCASLVLLAIVQSGNAAWIPGGVEGLWGPVSPENSAEGPDGHAPIGGRIAKVLAHFEFWAAEAPDMLRHKSVLERVVRDARGS